MLVSWSLTLQTIQEGQILVLHPGEEIEAREAKELRRVTQPVKWSWHHSDFQQFQTIPLP